MVHNRPCYSGFYTWLTIERGEDPGYHPLLYYTKEKPKIDPRSMTRKTILINTITELQRDILGCLNFRIWLLELIFWYMNLHMNPDTNLHLINCYYWLGISVNVQYLILTEFPELLSHFPLSTDRFWESNCITFSKINDQNLTNFIIIHKAWKTLKSMVESWNMVCSKKRIYKESLWSFKLTHLCPACTFVNLV